MSNEKEFTLTMKTLAEVAADRAREELLHRFGPYRAQTQETAPKYKQIQDKALEFALLIHDLCPDSREKATALTHLMTARMFANMSIALDK